MWNAYDFLGVILTNVLSLLTAAVLMASSSCPEQSSGPDPASVLCDKCKTSVLEPSQNTDDVSLKDRKQQLMREWLLSPRMWPIGYLIGSPYSPFRVEKQLPKRDWRNAFEDLLALESGGEMRSHESRTQEEAIAANLSWERTNYCLEKINKMNMRDAALMNRARTILNEISSPVHQEEPPHISWLKKAIKETREVVQRRIALAEVYKGMGEMTKELSASQRKDRGQWMSSLISSGALRGWISVLKDSEDGALIHLSKEGEAPEHSSGIKISEYGLFKYFKDGRPLKHGVPRAPLYRISYRPPAVPVNDLQILDETSFPPPPPSEGLMWSKVPERPYFLGQRMTAERITLPNGKTANKVVIKNWLTNGDGEEKVIIQDPGKVLQEVEKARALIRDRETGLDKPI